MQVHVEVKGKPVGFYFFFFYINEKSNWKHTYITCKDVTKFLERWWELYSFSWWIFLHPMLAAFVHTPPEYRRRYLEYGL